MAREANSIYEARTDEMVSRKDGKITPRVGRFLKPCTDIIDEAVKIPDTLLLSDFFDQNLQQWPSKVLFKGWKCRQKGWKEWVDKLCPKHGAVWKQTGILDAILSSVYEVRCNRNVVLGLVEYWCSETNTFLLPWGETTISLEDCMILAGLPVLGEPVTSPLMGDMVKLEEELNQKKREFSRTKAKKASYSAWIKHFAKTSEGELEHVAFLSLWLSRYVFPSLPQETVGNHVFSIAIHLSRGTPMALAPALLASLYQSLRLLKEQAMNSPKTIVVSGSFQLVQLWAFEHVPLLAPCLPNPLKLGEPRVARWHKQSFKITLPLVRSVLKLADNFQWRPYAADLKNWCHPSFYKEAEEVMYHCLNLNEELQSFVQCLCACELTGIDCKEKYMPHRVAMQFGFDQDLPADMSAFDFICLDAEFFVPARAFEPEVSARYFTWWKESQLTRWDAIKDVIVEKRSTKIPVVPPPVKRKRGAKVSQSFGLRSSKRYKKLAQVCSESESREENSSESGIMDDRLFDDDLPLSSKFKEHAAENCNAMVTPYFPANINNEILQDYTDDDDDHIPISAMLLKYHSQEEVVSPCSSDVNEINTGKREKPTKSKGINGFNRPCDGVAAEEVNRKAGYPTRVEKRDGHSTDDPVETDDVKVETKEGEMKFAAGESSDNPIDIDDNLKTATRISNQKVRFDVEGKFTEFFFKFVE